MSATLLASMAGFISAAIMSIISHTLLLRKEKKVRLQALQSKIHDEQLTAYKKLWSCLEPTSKFSSEKTLLRFLKEGTFLDRNVAVTFTNSIRGFFFSENGLFLSRLVRKELFGLLDHLQKIGNSSDSETDHLVRIDKKELTIIRNKIKALIVAIRSDVSLLDVEFPDHSEDDDA